MEILRDSVWDHDSWDGMEWVFAHGYEPSTLARTWMKAKEPERHPDCRVIQRNMLRTSILADLSNQAGSGVVLKRHHPLHWRDDARSILFPSRAFNEWKNLIRFQQLDLPAPVPVAYGERRHCGVVKDSCLITKALDAVRPIVPGFMLETASWKPEKRFFLRRELTVRLALLVARLHAAGIYYRDLHGGNILYRRSAGKPLELFFVDVDKAWFFSRLSRRRRLCDLAALYNSVFSDSSSMWGRFLIAYQAAAELRFSSWRDLLKSVKPVAQSYQRRHLKSRSRRCLRESSTFGKANTQGTEFYYRKDAPLSAIEAALQQAEARSRQSEPHQGQRRFTLTVAPSQAPGSIWHAAGYRYSGRQMLRSLFRPSKAKQAWLMGNALVARAVPTTQPLALAERRKFGMVTESYLLTSSPAHAEFLREYILRRFSFDQSSAPFPRLREFLKAFAASLTCLYRKSVFLPGLSANTIRVCETGSSWCFLFPCDSMATVDQPVCMEKLLQNLFSLQRSLPPEIGRSNLMWFYHELLRSRPAKERDIVVKELSGCITLSPEKESL